MDEPFDPVAGKHGRRDGMHRAARAADPAWWAFMLEAAREVARAKPFFFTDDLERLRVNREGPATPENRAIGPLMKEAQKLGICEPTDRWSPSSQKVNHGRYMRVWYSLIYVGPRISRPRRMHVIDPRQYDLLD
jgi:hypothetical protein